MRQIMDQRSIRYNLIRKYLCRLSFTRIAFGGITWKIILPEFLNKQFYIECDSN